MAKTHKLKRIKKPKVEDYLCDECGIVHQEEYLADLKKWKEQQLSLKR
jgi:hypothetical protein